MSIKRIISFAVASACVLLVTASCTELSVRRGPVVRPAKGPPAHAPAHGYRNKQAAGVELAFDARLGVYVVVGLTDHYYHDGYFYRLRGGLWEMSLKCDGGWAAVSMASLPPGLQAKSSSKGKGDGNGNGKGNGSGNGSGKHKRLS